MTRTRPAGAAPYVPQRATPRKLQEAVQSCRGCDLYAHATQAVFGEGPASAQIVFIGEQPGDEEDQKGRPFVGPAGKLLDRALVDAGIDRSLVYVTNAVKHFKFEERGRFVQNSWAAHVTSTVHPSSIPRAPEEQRHAEYRTFVGDLKKVQRLWANLAK